MHEIVHFLTRDRKDLYEEWITNLRDMKAVIAIDRRVGRMEDGNFGDHRFCRDGVWELKVDVGPGYRVYYAIADRRLVLLLCGGNERSQKADINRACDYWRKWKEQSE